MIAPAANPGQFGWMNGHSLVPTYKTNPFAAAAAGGAGGSTGGGGGGGGNFMADAWKYHQSQVGAINDLTAGVKDILGQSKALTAEFGKTLNPDTMAAAYGQDAVSAHDNATAGASRQLARFGINPLSGAWQGMSNARALARAAIDAGARNRGRLDALTQGAKLKMDLLGGQSYALRGLGDVASMWGDMASSAAAISQLKGGGAGGAGGAGGNQNSPFLSLSLSGKNMTAFSPQTGRYVTR